MSKAQRLPWLKLQRATTRCRYGCKLCPRGVPPCHAVLCCPDPSCSMKCPPVPVILSSCCTAKLAAAQAQACAFGRCIPAVRALLQLVTWLLAVEADPCTQAPRRSAQHATAWAPHYCRRALRAQASWPGKHPEQDGQQPMQVCRSPEISSKQLPPRLAYGTAAAAAAAARLHELSLTVRAVHAFMAIPCAVHTGARVRLVTILGQVTTLATAPA